MGGLRISRLAQVVLIVSYTIGIDVGGTNTNAALVKDHQVLETATIPTRHDELLDSTVGALNAIMACLPRDHSDQVELHLSTTLATNTIVEGKGDPTAVIVAPGPGMKIEDNEFPFSVFPIPGYVDHRGRVIAPLERDALRLALDAIKSQGFSRVAVVGKFSPRNPRQELEIEEWIEQEYPEFLPISLGHRLTGRLNLPRRITTAYLNATVTGVQSALAAAVGQVIKEFGLSGKTYLLKADGGTMSLEESLLRPVESILSGPAASAMGAISLAEVDKTNAVVLDIGGTTTDLSVLVRGKPVDEREGVEISGFKTSVPALFSRSVGLGGDSSVWRDGTRIGVGPHRAGDPVALGGSYITPTDAAVCAGGATIGDKGRAMEAMAALGKEWGVSPLELARRIIEAFCAQAVAAIEEAYGYLASLPVYTVAGILQHEDPRPEKVIGMGGPAAFFVPLIAKRLGVSYEVTPYHESANAVGAAAACPTALVTLRADTALGEVVVPELDYVSGISHPVLFDLKMARETVVDKAVDHAVRLHIPATRDDVEILEEESYNLVRDFHTVGRIISLKAQISPRVEKVHH